MAGGDPCNRTMDGAGKVTQHCFLTKAAMLAALAIAPITNAIAADLSGQTGIIDGDTLEIHGTRIRLWGIDAPETDQLCRNQNGEHYRCGQKAANDLDAFVGRRPVACIEVDHDQYRRTVAVCTVVGVDLAEWLVKTGLALDWPQYSKDAYAAAQAEAKRANLGMWSGSFNAPWRYRACRRTAGSPVTCSDQLNDAAF
jgi:endonuclease YncB( thermonuclease family)